ncbi:hypothetical protein HanHA300_Chr03g0077331 [Helianthus annuus]|nr:hypothetical protein HanHA300_Chr03g0077331 [Helianthus annuus]KAJ0599073.1 hypothetical protein HanIR_Chr03g0100741 [Helianthus annuus]KAJ0606730.1 hypothetical protein HanHA89_Chr03g0088471 [Helianthus annuus]KAJ0766782.1 hypothetical protein HanLR1_Chr03g0081571 [Helianthus annuus]KAJ0772667.1 hypothetical protein HanOQP8_Chr03g0090021 [Helianthus annuus]
MGGGRPVVEGARHGLQEVVEDCGGGGGEVTLACCSSLFWSPESVVMVKFCGGR